jgi:hypothetical protein
MMKQNIAEEQDYRCAVCGDSLMILGKHMQLAHRISQCKWAVEKYGEEVIHHRLNLRLVCSAACNAAVNMTNQPRAVARLVHKIQKALRNEKRRLY